jgi:capsular polysaccharide biosynthesis protein
MLQRDVDAAKASFEHAERRFAHTSLEAQATQSNVFVIKPAVEPLNPSFPKVGLYIAASLMLGAMLGLATVHTLEMLDRRVRCIDDVAALLKLPVLGVIEREAVAGALTVQRRDTPLALPR